MEEVHAGPVAQYHDEEKWLAERRKSVGGSEAAAIFGEHPFKTARELWAEKTGRAGEQTVTLAMERGRALEDIAAQRYELRTGRKTRRVPLKRRDDLPFLHASADRLVHANTGEGDYFTTETMALELKVPGYQVFEQIRRDGLRPYMIIQGQVEALLFGYPKVSFGLLHADSFRDLAFDMVSDPAAQDAIANEVGEWWERYVVKDVPPPDEAPTIKLPEVEGEITVVSDPAWEEAAREFAEAHSIYKEAEAIEKAAKDRLKALHTAFGARVVEGAGVRTYLMTEDGRASWKQTVDAILAAHPEIDVDEFLVTGKAFQKFVPYVLRDR